MAKKLTKAAMTIGLSLRRAARVTIRGAVIGRTSIFFGGGVSTAFSALRVGFGVDLDPNSGPFSLFDEPGIFERHAISPADVGKTFYEDATTDSNFVSVASRLTDGMDGLVFLRMSYVPDTGATGALGMDESSAFRGSALTNGIDFAGQKITRIGMRIDALRFYVDDSEGFIEYRHEGYVTILIERKRLLRTRVSLSTTG